ncbi:hypothetical protein Bbelb_198930 [Branchiostoma belcheri]|nr:hypothetical protein Bbelb_198930 [Branchiostoma belcheri]
MVDSFLSLQQASSKFYIRERTNADFALPTNFRIPTTTLDMRSLPSRSPPRSDRDDDEMWQHQPKLFRTPKEAMKLETNGKHARTSEKWTDRAVGAPRQRGRGAAMCSRQHSRALLHGLPSSFRLSSSGSSESESETESTENESKVLFLVYYLLRVRMTN